MENTPGIVKSNHCDTYFSLYSSDLSSIYETTPSLD